MNPPHLDPKHQLNMLRVWLNFGIDTSATRALAEIKAMAERSRRSIAQRCRYIQAELVSSSKTGLK